MTDLGLVDRQASQSHGLRAPCPYRWFAQVEGLLCPILPGQKVDQGQNPCRFIGVPGNVGPIRLLGLLRQAEAIEKDGADPHLVRVLFNVVADQYGEFAVLLTRFEKLGLQVQHHPGLISGDERLECSQPFFGLIELAKPSQQVHIEDQVPRLAAAVFQDLPHLGPALRPVALSRVERDQKEPLTGCELLRSV